MFLFLSLQRLISQFYCYGCGTHRRKIGFAKHQPRRSDENLRRKNTDFRNSFGRDLKKIADRTLKAEIKPSILSVENAMTIGDIPELKKLKGYKKGIYYRIAVGDYRIGVTIEHDMVTFYAVNVSGKNDEYADHKYQQDGIAHAETEQVGQV